MKAKCVSYCDAPRNHWVFIFLSSGTETTLHNAVRRREATIASRLLAAGANPNLAIYSSSSSAMSLAATSSGAVTTNAPSPSPSSASQQSEEEFYFKGSTCLVEACRNRDLAMIDLLLKYSAR